MDILKGLTPVTERMPMAIYKGVLDNLPLACVDVVLHRITAPKTSDVLMVHRLEEPSKGMLWFPGGRIVKNVGLTDMVRVHLQRECGLDDSTFDIGRQIGTFDYSSRTGVVPGLNEGFHALGTCYLARLKNPNHPISLDHTSRNYEWTNELMLRGVTLHPYIAEVLNASRLFEQRFDNVASL